jgi:magnesium-dependent phosphatase 1
LLGLLQVPSSTSDVEAGEASGPTAAVSFFDHMEIYPGSKIAHFRQLQKKTGLSYDEMLFFDDESRNKNVEELGVIMYLVHNGVTRNEIDAGIQSWRKRKGRDKKET